MTKGLRNSTGLPQRIGGKVEEGPRAAAAPPTDGPRPPVTWPRVEAAKPKPAPTIAERILANREKRERVAIGINGGRLVVHAADDKPADTVPPTWAAPERKPTAAAAAAKTPPLPPATWPTPERK